MTHRTRIYGLDLDSDLPLHQDRPVSGTRATPFEIRVGAAMPATAETPPGRVLLDLRANQQYYTGTATDDGFRLRFYGSCDVRIDHPLTRATLHPVQGADPAVLPVLAGGTLLAFVLALQGAPILHASAVQVGPVAVAFAGASGMGKSTMATLLCAGTGALITDDLLRLDLGVRPPGCALGATETRLRNGREELTNLFEDAPSARPTGDSREALAVRPATEEGVPLAAVVVPFPDKSSDRRQPTVERLGGTAALLLLARFPRLLGWRDATILEQQFQHLGEIVDAVPVHVAHLPWGPPFPARTGDKVLAALGL